MTIDVHGPCSTALDAPEARRNKPTHPMHPLRPMRTPNVTGGVRHVG
ncbi:hypothetical protein QYH69_31300 [Paraburkholderia sp. SARCC-3016]|nr:hypothetical protein [Paraburkholderia sp. SARCC-3016]MDQ7981714.1 hypothetical protein [Paraburkholderia sp. SARCC-3016]